jgi:hypothetical protein
MRYSEEQKSIGFFSREGELMSRERVVWMLLLAAFSTGLGFAQSAGFESLTPRKDVTEHWVIVGRTAEVWSVQDGVIAYAGKPMGYLRSKQKYQSYVLRAEWRFQKEGSTTAPERWPNAGFFIHASEEVGKVWPKSFVEVQGYYGEAGSVFSGGIKGAKRGPIVKDRVPLVIGIDMRSLRRRVP